MFTRSDNLPVQNANGNALEMSLDIEATLHHLKVLHSKHTRISTLLIAGYIIGSLVVLALLFTNVFHINSRTLLLLALGMAPFFSLFMCCAHNYGLGSTNYRYALEAVCNRDDVRLLGAMLDASSFVWAGERSEIRRAIRRLVPLVSEEHAGLLSASQMNALWGMAFRDWYSSNCADDAFACAVLRTLSHVGSLDILLKMERVADTVEYQSSKKRVRACAQECVPILEENLRRRSVPETLLRPSALPASPDTLLRAASPQVAVEDAVELLRAR